MPINIKGKMYRTVWERLNVAHGDGAAPVGIASIDTEVVATAPLLIVKATVTFTDGRRFSGLSEAKLDAAPNSADGTNPAECAETSSVGRALAFAGYYGSDDGIAGADEVRRAIRDQERAAPPVKKAAAPAAPAPARTTTAKLSPDLTILEHYQALAKQAEAEGLTDIVDLASDAPDETIRDYGAALLKRLKAARAAGLAPVAPPAAAPPRTNGAPLATAKQIETIAKLAAKVGRRVDTDGLTRAQASEVLTELIGTMDAGR